MLLHTYTIGWLYRRCASRLILRSCINSRSAMAGQFTTTHASTTPASAPLRTETNGLRTWPATQASFISSRTIAFHSREIRCAPFEEGAYAFGEIRMGGA